MPQPDHIPLCQTSLHSAHVALGAKMGAFAGYDMPLYYYDLGVLKEHEWVRSHCGVFDVSHMGQVRLKGQGVRAFLEQLTPSSFVKLPLNRAKYTVMVNEHGGIIDDLMVIKITEDEFFLVINAGCKAKDIKWIASQLPSSIALEYLDAHALIALQGPMAEQVMADVLGINLSHLKYMELWQGNLPDLIEGDVSLMISRLGYTGEDGFEISMSAESAPKIWQKLLGHDKVRPIGLAARDSLRLEMGYCLYGHDIDETTTPREADLEWVMARDRIADFEIPRRKRVGVMLLDKGVAREGAVVLSESGEHIGQVSSGGYSPTIKQSIGQAYLPLEHCAEGNKIFIQVRGNKIPAEIRKMPFVPARTKGASPAIP